MPLRPVDETDPVVALVNASSCMIPFHIQHGAYGGSLSSALNGERGAQPARQA